MTKEIFINRTAFETRLALVEDKVLQQIHIDRDEEPSLVGNIYKAKVLRVMPGMQSAFVDIGSDRNAFIPIDNIFHAKPGDKILDILGEGQDILVQVVKDPINKKGALVTTDLSIATDYLVYRHGRTKPGISAQIKQKEERSRLNDLLNTIVSAVTLPERLTGNFIVRSAAEGITDDELTSDINFLIKIWRSIESLRVQKSPVTVYQNTQKFQSLIANMLDQGATKITVDCEIYWKKLNDWCDLHSRGVNKIFELYSGEGHLFDMYQIEDQINAALNLEVALDCGGYLVIEETEALSVIDVNTGSFIGESIDHNTFFRVNLEAALECVKQIKLRHLTGIIIIDFIDMQNSDHRSQVLKQLKNAFSQDSDISIISDFTELGLVQVARKKTRKSLRQIVCEPCNHCEAKGVIKSEETLSLEIFRELTKIDSNCVSRSIEIYASDAVIKLLENKYSTQLNDFTNRTNCDVKLIIERSLQSNQFNIIPA
ncbi:MAG: Rne/Rng family ribonuclease [Porticoccaceae bacterium]